MEEERIGGTGPLIGISIVSAAKRTDVFASYAEHSMERLLDSAREMDGKSDPNDGKLPSSEAIIRAALIDCGYEPDAEGVADEAGAEMPAPALRDMVCAVWEIWTGNGRGLDIEGSATTFERARSAARETWAPGITLEVWQAAALERLGHVSDEQRQAAAVAEAKALIEKREG
ncbi:hypothetical protein [Falsiroseomonas tokyonensis]|uniref:Uncharacterized protein n=1 Tax=Falsiroseomonas tokyonensis TaxID=430521 RepID=A0ABV7C0M2_9PROT|nr:hypothetical protein [Falsiroseomonas tokyonensis]MBU8540199.1 hypothetical protein [Falsiroseomonas tokyonensis]